MDGFGDVLTSIDRGVALGLRSESEGTAVLKGDVERSSAFSRAVKVQLAEKWTGDLLTE